MLLVGSLILVLLMVLLAVQFFLSEVRIFREPQLTSLESGYERLKHGIVIRSSFFMLAVLFVMFDVELVVLFPLIIYMPTTISFEVFLTEVFLVVALSLFLEWKFLGLKWRYCLVNVLAYFPFKEEVYDFFKNGT